MLLRYLLKLVKQFVECCSASASEPIVIILMSTYSLKCGKLHLEPRLWDTIAREGLICLFKLRMEPLEKIRGFLPKRGFITLLFFKIHFRVCIWPSLSYRLCVSLD